MFIFCRHQNGKKMTTVRSVRSHFSGTFEKCGRRKRLASDNTIAASVGRPYVINVAIRNPRYQPWDTSMMSEYVMIASRRLQMKSKF